jgi:hypothetical protein
MPIYYAQTTGRQQTNSASPVAVTGLRLVIPEGVNLPALIILNVPNPFAQGDNHPGGMFQIAVNDRLLEPIAAFTYSDSNMARVPTTLVVSQPLGAVAQTIQAMWAGIRGSSVIIDSPASLSVIV